MLESIDSKLITNMIGVFLVIFFPIVFYFLLKPMRVKHDPDLD